MFDLTRLSPIEVGVSLFAEPSALFSMLRFDMAHLLGQRLALHKVIRKAVKCAVLGRSVISVEHSKSNYRDLFPMRIPLYFFLALTGLGAPNLGAETASEIYQRRVVPLLQSTNASSCTECHLQGVKLVDFLSLDPQASFASLRARGWIDVDNPSDSKFLQFIAKRPTGANELMEKVRQAELDAIGQWIRASVADPESISTPLPKLDDLKLDELLIHSAHKKGPDPISIH